MIEVDENVPEGYTELVQRLDAMREGGWTELDGMATEGLDALEEEIDGAVYPLDPMHPYSLLVGEAREVVDPYDDPTRPTLPMNDR